MNITHSSRTTQIILQFISVLLIFDLNLPYKKPFNYNYVILLMFIFKLKKFLLNNLGNFFNLNSKLVHAMNKRWILMEKSVKYLVIVYLITLAPASFPNHYVKNPVIAKS